MQDCFDTKFYLKQNPDLVFFNGSMALWKHFIFFGQFEPVGQGARFQASQAAAGIAANSARARPIQIGSRSTTARRVIGSVSENIATPASPSSMPRETSAAAIGALKRAAPAGAGRRPGASKEQEGAWLESYPIVAIQCRYSR